MAHKMGDEAMQKKIRELYKRYPVNPHKELAQWEKWITIRKEEIEHLSKVLDEPPVDLTMNMLEKVRADKENKIVLEHAQIRRKVEIDIREVPCTLPIRLLQKHKCEPIYELTHTRVEKSRPPIIEHIGVPKCLQVAEKGLTGDPQRKPKEKLDSDYNKYKQKREVELKRWVKRVNPFTPDTDNLIIIGKKPVIPPPPPPLLPDIVVKPPFEPPLGPLWNIYAIRVNNSVFYKSIPYQPMSSLKKYMDQDWHETCNNWTYYFNIPTGNVGRSTLYLQNLGTVTLRYCWKKLKRQIQYIPETTEEQVFFFNKNEDVLSPGQYRNIKFSFVSKYPGSFKEYWEFILCNVPGFDVPETSKMTVNLSGDATEHIERKTGYIDLLLQKIEKRSVLAMINDMINDIVERAITVEPQICPYKQFFLEAELFVLKNPVCFYHQTEVKKLNDRYVEMTKGKQWDLSITTWRNAMIALNFEERMQNFEFLRQCHAHLLKPWYEGDELSYEKHRAVKLLLGQLMDRFYDEYVRLCKIYDYKDDRPVTYPDFNKPQEEYQDNARKISKLNEDRDYTKLELTVKNCFYMVMYEYIAQTIEFCAGVLSSLDLNRFLDFDFCQMY